jgi:large exoprotein involved in heme utilization and adhesion
VLGAAGNGGNIAIDPALLVLDHSSIIAQAVAGHGGNITIAAGNFIASSDSIVSASSQLGISGNVELIGPRVDLNGSLVVLASELRSAADILRTGCRARGGKQSSLVDAGHGGLPQDTETTIPALYIVDRDPAPRPGGAAGEGGPRLPTAREKIHPTMGCG